jgi:hypothetical protein
MVMSQAVAVPTANAIMATPLANKTVRTTAPGRTVRKRCGQIFSSGVSASTTIVATGSAMTARIAATAAVHAGDVRRFWRHAAIACNTRELRSTASLKLRGELDWGP